MGKASAICYAIETCCVTAIIIILTVVLAPANFVIASPDLTQPNLFLIKVHSLRRAEAKAARVSQWLRPHRENRNCCVRTRHGRRPPIAPTARSALSSPRQGASRCIARLLLSQPMRHIIGESHWHGSCDVYRCGLHGEVTGTDR